MHDFKTYEKIGSTRDDAVGEAFDKVARMLGLPYPGGPEISRLATQARAENLPTLLPPLPRPMIHTPDFDFSFSGLKTAVRTRVLDKEISDSERVIIARDFEDATTEVLIKKTSNALKQTNAQTLILGGGVTANTTIRDAFQNLVAKEFPDVTLHLPDPTLSTDNAIMIALSGHARVNQASINTETLTANGNLSL